MVEEVRVEEKAYAAPGEEERGRGAPYLWRKLPEVGWLEYDEIRVHHVELDTEGRDEDNGSKSPGNELAPISSIR